LSNASILLPAQSAMPMYIEILEAWASGPSRQLKILRPMWGYRMNRKWSFILGLLGLAALALSLPIGLHVLGKARARAAFTPARPQDSSLLQARAAAEYGRLPLSFEENRGQTDPRVKFMARGGGYTVFLTDDESTTFRLSAPSGGSEKAGNLARLSSRANSPAAPPDAVVRLALAGSNPHAPVEGLELQAGRSNYFIGNDPSRWQRNVPHYARVKYRGVYPGVDLIYYGHQGHLESDYVLAPGADPSQIGLRIDGASSVKFDSEGNLLLATTAGDVVLQKPRTYQEIAGERREIATSYVRRGPRMVGLRVAPYDSREPLIIDPAMIYSTYLGGTGSDIANGIAVDSTKNAYVTGSTGSKDFPTTVFQKTFLSTVSGAHEIFVSKLAIDGSGLVYSTFIGGLDSSASDTSTAIALDSAGDAYITGTTGAKQFPTTTSAYQLQNLNSAGTAFMTKLAPDGASLLYSTYFGGGSGGIGLQNGSDAGRGIAVDSAGIAYLTGTTSSGNFPNTPGKAIQTTNPNQTATAFVSKINPSLIGTGSLVYSTFLGGTNFDQGNAIAVEPTSGIVYVTGFTGSTDFPVNGTVAAFQPALAVVGRANAFISKIDTTLSGTSGLLYSTYLGGTGSASSGDLGQAIAVDANANVFVAGLAASTNFPVSTGAVQTTNKNTTAGTNGFVARLDTTKSGAASRVYATYLGGAGNDQCRGIAVDSLQNAYVTGITNSSFLTFSTFITTGAPQAQIVGNQNAFAVVLNPTGSGVVFGTYWGGDGNTQGHAIALDTASPPAIYITGSDTSSNSSLIVSANAFQKARQAGNQISAFVAKFTTGAAAGNISVAPTTLNFGSLTVNTTSTPQAITLTNGSSSALTINSFPITGANASDFTVSRPTGTSACPAPGA
jgi:hypothetical protein